MKPLGNSPLVSYPWYVPDWQGSETRARLNLAARGLFRELLDHCHTEGSLPNDPKVLARIAGCSLKEFNRLFPLVEDQFREVDGRFINPKAAEVREKLLRYHEDKRFAGTAGAKKRWQDRVEKEPSSDLRADGELSVSDLRAFGELSVSGSSLETKEDTSMQTSLGDSTKADSTATVLLMGNHSLPLPLPLPLPQPYPQTPKPPSDDGLFSVNQPPFDPPWEDELERTAKAIHARHPSFRRCSLKTVQEKLQRIARSVPAGERVALLAYIDQQHEKWCNSDDWRKEDGQYVDGLEKWLNPKKNRWENDLRSIAKAPAASVNGVYLDYHEAEQ